MKFPSINGFSSYHINYFGKALRNLPTTNCFSSYQLNYIGEELKNFLLLEFKNTKDEIKGSYHFRKLGRAATLSYISNASANPEAYLYIRFGDNLFEKNGKKEIFISTLSFKKNERKNVTAFLDLLCDIAQKFDYNVISFESNESCDEWPTRLGLSKMYDCCPTDLITAVQKYKKHFYV